MQRIITTRTLAAMKPGETLADPAPRGTGRLEARKLQSGIIAWYYRHTLPDGRRDRLVLGKGLTLAQAREEAARLSHRYQSGDRELRSALEQDEAERKLREERQRTEAERKANASFGALMEAYAASLQARGKDKSARDTRSAITRHMRPLPDLWNKPAQDITPEDVMRIVVRVADTGKLRMADKLRSYVGAAYAAAIRARLKAGASPDLRRFRLDTNPARDLGVVEGSRTSRDRALTVAELRSYWARIRDLPAPDGPLLRFHLLTGGQRIEQLARLTASDYDRDTRTITLRDPKGRRSEPRLHVIPLIPDAVDALHAMRSENFGPYIYTTSNGHRPADYYATRCRLEKVVHTMQEAGELEGAPFTPGDLRRTVETRLAAEGVHMDVRAQLQSHGLGGVQARHYDRHDYLNEKRAALETLHRLLTGASAKVLPLKRRRR